MDGVTRSFLAIAGAGVGIIAAAVGLKVYQSDTLAAVVVGGTLAIGALLALAVVGVVAVRLVGVSREAREQRLIIARTLAALANAGANATSAPTFDPSMFAGLLGTGDGAADPLAGGGDTGRWVVERPKHGGDNGRW